MNKQDLIKEVKELKIITVAGVKYIGSVVKEEDGCRTITGMETSGEEFDDLIRNYIRQRHLGELISIEVDGYSAVTIKGFTDPQLDAIEIVCIVAARSINKAIKNLEADAI